MCSTLVVAMSVACMVAGAAAWAQSNNEWQAWDQAKAAQQQADMQYRMEQQEEQSRQLQREQERISHQMYLDQIDRLMRPR